MDSKGSSSAAAAAASDETDLTTVATDYVREANEGEAGSLVQGHLSQAHKGLGPQGSRGPTGAWPARAQGGP